jgi:nucleoside-diphosphate-sugar epimerase
MDLRGRNVMVTGGAGFIGSALVRGLVAEGAHPVVFDDLSVGCPENLAEVADALELVTGDIRSPMFAEVLAAHEIDCVFHLAALPFIPDCYKRPRDCFEINAGGALNVLLACKQVGVRRVVLYSSASVYGSAQRLPMDETHPLNPVSTYAVSKLAADRLCFSLGVEQGLETVVLRQFNVYGPRMTHPYVTARTIDCLEREGRVRLHDADSRRDFLYVDDAVRAALAVMTTEACGGEVFNLGSGTDHTIREVVELLAEIMGHSSAVVNGDDGCQRKVHIPAWACDSSKLRKCTGWEPSVSLQDGMTRTVEHFRAAGCRWPWGERAARWCK